MERRSWLVLALVAAGGLAACEPPRDRDRPAEPPERDQVERDEGVAPTTPATPGTPITPAPPEEEPEPGGTPYRNP